MFECKNLKIYHKEKNLVDISFKIEDSLALIGESGSGKSLTIKAILNMLPKSLKYDLNKESSFNLINGQTITFVPQNPFTSLSPITKIRDQFLIDLNLAKENLKLVGLEEKFLDRFPSELSGGQLQRVIIAMAINPTVELMLLDEPTTALDIESKELILKLLLNLKKKFNFKILFVTHDIESVKNICKEVCVINRGKIIERGDLKEILENPQDKYTKNLIESNFAYRGFRE